LDTPAEQKGYAGADANAAAKTWLAGVTDNTSLGNALVPTNLNTNIAKVVAIGTPFTIVSALTTLDVATEAKADFLAAADGDDDATTSLTEAQVTGAVTTKDAAVAALITTGAGYATGSAAVKAALLSDQAAANSKALADAQTAVADANTKIAKVAGLTAAVSSLTAANASAKAADTVQTAAAADLAAKVASYNVLHTAAVTVATNGTVAGLIELADGKLALVSGITEAKNAGVSALLSASVAFEAAEKADVAAHKAVDVAQLQVNHLDVDTVGAEAADLAAVKALMVGYADVTIASDAMPTEAQITTQMAILQAKSDAGDGSATTALTDFTAKVGTYHASAAVNPLVGVLNTATTQVTTASDSISALTKAVAALNTAQGAATQLDALNKSIDAAVKVFADHDLNLVEVAAPVVIASGDSDVFVATDVDSTIALFNLQGSDSLFIGTDYVLNTGKLSAGSDSALEAFVSNVSGDAVIKLETSVFGSHAATPEVVTITLTGVDATHVHLSNGIITVS
jgi:hypothetical protein